ncbi:UNVERIFIED_CONTAM: hypothetical protein KB579_08045 [Streptococcus canis]|nr:hypothetical protein [Streptococcus canis]
MMTLISPKEGIAKSDMVSVHQDYEIVLQLSADKYVDDVFEVTHRLLTF